MGIIHRDIKPANIMVLDRTSEDIAKGQPGQMGSWFRYLPCPLRKLARGADQANVVMGSARYMSPEQVSGKDVDARAAICTLLLCVI